MREGEGEEGREMDTVSQLRVLHQICNSPEGNDDRIEDSRYLCIFVNEHQSVWHICMNSEYRRGGREDGNKKE